ncbi:riboflavin synthase [Robiginitalea sp. SC105]|uniref:riboflavin synthase n=1 Tax=Robiginitalea sp. SC105 TaxID=2762332 RepID=UPI00163A96B2|nr:riboflavin synthase [Robiginitalea sp. SC105]MBC2838104.1 riboflavin synthase [Robiginitalea sp. SC105]
MFTGIIETLATVSHIRKDRSNLDITLESPLARELKIDQSLAHNGVCLTVVAVGEDNYTVTAVQETLNRSNLGSLREGDRVNLERAMVLGARLDGHIVQGHVDQVGHCTHIDQKDGSWLFGFEYEPGPGRITIEKGSITVDGVSLTVVDSAPGHFSVAIIPYTYEHTRFREYRPGSPVNLEFDMIGKYVARLVAPHQPAD